MKDLVAVCRKHNAFLGACSCCNHISGGVGQESFGNLSDIDGEGYQLEGTEYKEPK